MSSNRIALVLLSLALITRPGFAADAPTPAPTAVPSPSPSPIKITPYGTVFFSGYSNSGGTNNTDIPLWAVAGAANAGATVRGTRLGLKMSGASVGSAQLSGQIETDFFGGFPTIGIGDNMGDVRVRLATARLDWAKTSVIIGQDWTVFAPLNPTSIACTGIPLMAGSGNPWARLPQVRFEEKLAHVLVQAAVLSPSTGDFTSTFLAQPSSGGLSRLPFAQARLGVRGWGAGKTGLIAVSGHVGRSRVIPASGAKVDVDSNAAAVDWTIPLGTHVVLTGEALAGKNLGGFQAGIFQGINPDFGTPPAAGETAKGVATAIKTKGGWAQLSVTPPGFAKGTFYATGGIEDPDDDTLVSATKRDWRLKNTTFAGSFIYKASPLLSLGAEVRHVETKLLQTGTQKNTHVNLAASLSF